MYIFYNLLNQKKAMILGDTEPPYTGKYWNLDEKGKYHCKKCGQIIFESERKIDSSKGPMGLRGWPAFDDVVLGAISLKNDLSLGMHRIEVSCSKCKTHLGHVFDDYDTSTNKHYCINSYSLEFCKNEDD